MKRARLAAAMVALALLAGCATRPRSGRGALDEAEIGLASFYSDSLRGRPTASGAPYDPGAFTCAHRTMPFGARLKVTELTHGRSVMVIVNDRGPFVTGRIIDLSGAAAEALGIIGAGVAQVRVERLRRRRRAGRALARRRRLGHRQGGGGAVAEA